MNDDRIMTEDDYFGVNSDPDRVNHRWEVATQATVSMPADTWAGNTYVAGGSPAQAFARQHPNLIPNVLIVNIGDRDVLLGASRDAVESRWSSFVLSPGASVSLSVAGEIWHRCADGTSEFTTIVTYHDGDLVRPEVWANS
jgi:hypothetical protein